MPIVLLIVTPFLILLQGKEKSQYRRGRPSQRSPGEEIKKKLCHNRNKLAFFDEVFSLEISGFNLYCGHFLQTYLPTYLLTYLLTYLRTYLD